MKLIRKISLLLLFILSFELSAGDSSSLHDAHIHYSEDVWNDLPPAAAIRLLREQGITQALVSSTPTEGAEILYQQDSGLIIPMLRPYKDWRHRYYWFRDPDLLAYLKEHLSRAPYRGFGEFHVFGEDARTKQMAEMISLARQRNLLLHAHTDLEGMQEILAQSDSLKVIWAHGGFDVPVSKLRHLLDQYPGLYIELSYREGLVDSDGGLTNEWKSFFISYPKRFLLGMDTYKPSRWAALPELVENARHWLAELPPAVAEDISRNNFTGLVSRDVSL